MYGPVDHYCNDGGGIGLVLKIHVIKAWVKKGPFSLSVGHCKKIEYKVYVKLVGKGVIFLGVLMYFWAVFWEFGVWNFLKGVLHP